MAFSCDVNATETTDVQLATLEQEARSKIRTMTELSGLYLTKEEKEVLAKWRGQWENGLKRICKAIEKEYKHLEKECEKQQQKELDKIAKKDAPKFLFVSFPGKKGREEASRTAEFRQQQTFLQNTLNTNLAQLEKKLESQIHEHLQQLSNKVRPYRAQVESRISKKTQHLEELKAAPYLFRVIAGNGEEVTGDPDQELHFEVWVREDRRAECYIEQNKAALLSSDKDKCGLWSETEIRQYLKARQAYLEKRAYQKGFAEGQKGGYEKGFEAGRRAGLEVRIDDERFEALDEVQRDSNEEWTSQWMHTTIDTI